MVSKFLIGELYDVVAKNDKYLHIKLADSTHVVFQAHFPTYPVVPGFLLVDIFAHEYGASIVEVATAQFKNVVTPNEEIIYTSKVADEYVDVEIRKENNIIVSRFKIKCV